MRARVWVVTAALVAVVSGGLAVAALLAWPRARLRAADDAVARVVLPGVARRVAAVDVHSAGAVEVAAAARSWERLPAPVRVSWFPARPYPQLLAEPTPGTMLAPDRQLTLTFSSPVRGVLGARRPRRSPAMPGRWRLLDAHT